VHGDAVLDGQLLIDLIGSYDPTVGHYFDVLTATGTITDGLVLAGDEPSSAVWTKGVFDTAGGQVLRLTAVPEPSTFILSALGLPGLAFVGRRRRKR